jgi:hypothetical protein
MSKINKEWYSYPPIVASDAEYELNTKYPTLSYTTIAGYYFIEDGETPYYLYKGNNGETTKYYLVSAYDKVIVVKKNRNNNEPAEEKLPLKLTENGLMMLDSTIISSLSDKDLEQLKTDIELTNNYIKEGILKFDSNMNVIYDKRNEVNGNIFTSEENIQYFESDSTDDGKMDGSEVLIE